MKVAHYETIPQQDVTMDGAQGCKIRLLIGEPDGAPHFAMRQFEVVPGGHTPYHQHPYEHEVFVLEGSGVVRQGEREFSIGPGSVVFVPANEIHQFRAVGDRPLKFLCLIPHAVRGTGISCVAACSCD